MEYIINLKDEINKSTANFVELEINKALEGKYTSLTLIINSFGGSVYDGMSIVSAIKNAGLPTKAKIEGYCASMAAIIAMTCDRIEMAEHGILMFHNPYIEGVDEMSASEKQAMELTANSLITLASRKVPRKFLKKIMEKETWIDSSQAELMGMVDEVYDINLLENTGLIGEFNKAFVNKNQDLLNKIYSKLKTNMEINTENKDEVIVDKMVGEDVEMMTTGITEGEEENVDDVVDEVDYKSMYNEMLMKLKEMTGSMDTMKNQIDLFTKNETKHRLDKAIERVELAINEGRIDEGSKGEWIETLQNNYDLGVKMINTIKVSTKAPELPFMNKTKVKDVKDNFTIRDYEEKDPNALKEILNNNKPLYKQLFQDFYGVEYKD